MRASEAAFTTHHDSQLLNRCPGCPAVADTECICIQERDNQCARGEVGAHLGGTSDFPFCYAIVEGYELRFCLQYEPNIVHCFVADSCFA
jgi:hypothetical protein